MFENKKCGAKVFFFVAMATLLISIMLIPAGNAAVGVSAGQWAKYGDFSTSYYPPPEPTEVTDIKNTEWEKVDIVSVTDSNVEVRVTTHYNNDTENTYTLTENVETGNLSVYIIPKNLGLGDPINVTVYGVPPDYLKINQTVTRTYAGASREVNLLQLNYSGLLSSTNGSFYWDKATGILCELSYSTIDYFWEAWWTMAMKIEETNMWSGGVTPPAGGLGDIFTQWWFWLIIVVVIVGVVGGVVVLKMRTKKVPPPPLPPPPPPPPPPTLASAKT